MAGFCTRCGKALQDGEVCNCTQQTAQPQQAAQQTQQFQQTQQAVTGFLTRVSGAFLNVVKHPVTSTREMIQAADYQVGIALIVLQGLFTAIFGAVAASKVLSLVGGIFGGMPSIFRSYKIELPYAKIIIGTMLISAALSFVLALLLMLGNMMIKNTVTYQQMIAAVASRSCVVVVTNILAIIVYLLNPVAGLTVFGMGNIWGFFVILQAMPLAEESMKDKLPTIMIIVYLVFAIVTGFSMKAGQKLYTPTDSVEDSMSDFEDIFG